MITIIKSIEEFENLRTEWDELFSSSEYITPFQSFCFNYYNWNILEHDKELHIICISRQRDKKLLAIFPCVLTSKGILHFINGIHSDFCGAIIEPNSFKDYYLYKEFSEYINSNNQIKGFLFDNLKSDNYLLSILGYFFKGMQTRISNRWSNLTLKEVDASENSFLSSLTQLSSKDRYKIKNILKKAPNAELKLFHIKEDPFPKSIVDDLIQTMFDLKLRSDAYFSEKFKEVLNQIYNEGLLTIACSLSEKTPLAANLYLISGNEYIDWLAIYKDGRYNTPNLLQMMEYICNTGGGIFNFARGIYEYKISNFRPEIHNLYRIEYSKTRGGQIGILLSFVKYYLKEFLRPILKK